MASYNSGFSELEMDAHPVRLNSGPIVFLGAYSGYAPVLGIHMTPAEAAELVRKIAVSLESLSQEQMADGNQTSERC
jgi:hypothetical protein